MMKSNEKSSFYELFLFLVSCILIINSACCLEPVSTATIGFGAGGLLLSAGYTGYEYVKCRYFECCNDRWIRTNFDDLEQDLRARLHGQHLANFIISRSIQSHLQKKNPKKALVLAFHGWTGSGKNHAIKIIVENLYKEGTKSKYVHWYISTTRFPRVSEVEKYKDELRQEIVQHTKLCDRSVFVFDAVDKMPPGVIDALKPYMDYHDEVEGVDYRRNIFIFLSNTGSTEIAKVAFQSWMKGEERESITMRDIELLVNKDAFNEKGGPYREISKESLIDAYVPFLPLEKKHVRLCIKDEMYSRSIFAPNPEVINMVVNKLQYYPPEREVFSLSGCKRIKEKLDIYI